MGLPTDKQRANVCGSTHTGQNSRAILLSRPSKVAAALLKALKASFPRIACCRDFETGECAHGDQPCKCEEAGGVLPLWPWK